MPNAIFILKLLNVRNLGILSVCTFLGTFLAHSRHNSNADTLSTTQRTNSGNETILASNQTIWTETCSK